MSFIPDALRGMAALGTLGASEGIIGAATGKGIGEIGKNIASSAVKGFTGGTVDPEAIAEDPGKGIASAFAKGAQLAGTLAGGAGLAGAIGGGAAFAFRSRS